ncbi:Estradiol 17-beta-dehydrogenase 11 [Orchesella cincta]|uniref:Short-chain dehydrogenase/reductase 3 n=1 Tax=Orchesella cincta TaxID=48709 RepID=A0A1D2N5X9_ORCCI|nr:Estradiol 17-beta-dehydrogenase 11 [Orchesella cincta]
MDYQEVLLQILAVLTHFLRVIYWYLEALFRQFVPPPMKTIDGETVVVTGAAGGIGKEICRHLVRSTSNIKLVLWDLNLSDLEKLAEELKKNGKGAKVFPFAVDISTRDNIEAACKLVKDTVGPVSIIFNNAGIAPTGNFLNLTNEQIEKTIDINLMSHFWLIRELLPDMVTKNHGRIVNICSMGGLKAAPLSFPYFASKFAVHGYTESLKLELEMFNLNGIKVSTVYPYFVQTGLIKTLTPDKEKMRKMPAPFQKFLEPAEVGRKIVDGMRREYEHIYLPASIPILIFIDSLVPMKLRKMFQSHHSTSFIYKDNEEQKLFTVPFLVTSPVKNGKVDKKEE